MDSLANRYASALLSLALEKNAVTDYKMIGNFVVNCFEEYPDFLRLLDDSFIDKEKRYDVVDEVFAPLKCSDVTSLIKVIIDNHRGNIVLAIFKEFNHLCNEELHINEGIVYSAVELKQEQIARIEEKISLVLKEKVELVNKINPSLIGGVRIVVDEKVFDGSVINKVDSLKRKLLKIGAEDEN